MRPSAGLLVLASVVGCGEPPAEGPRPQLVVYVDTDAPVTEQVATNTVLAKDAAVDTLLVGVTDSSGVIDSREFIVRAAASWPVSFGIVTPEGRNNRTVLLRLRLFLARYAEVKEAAEAFVLEPPQEVTIERLALLTLPPSGIRRVWISLASDCRGIPPAGDDSTTCLDGDLNSGEVGTIDELDGGDIPATRAGSWPGAFPVPCAGPPPAGSVCVPGGFAIIGGTGVQQATDTTAVNWQGLVPVRMSPFFMDVDEYSIARFRRLSAAIPETLLPTVQEINRSCTFSTKTGRPSDSLPLNCVEWETAKLACEADGGMLPTEAQWEYAASGRGDGRSHPWGDAAATCCAASVERFQGACGSLNLPETPGSHEDTTVCAGIADVSRDGVRDLAGSLSEAVADSAVPYHPTGCPNPADPEACDCWMAQGSSGALADPKCEQAGQLPARRGGDWGSSFGSTFVAIRRSYLQYAGAGFRCVYADGSP